MLWCRTAKKRNRGNRECCRRIIAPVHIILSLPGGEQKRHSPRRVKYWEIIAEDPGLEPVFSEKAEAINYVEPLNLLVR